MKSSTNQRDATYVAEKTKEKFVSNRRTTESLLTFDGMILEPKKKETVAEDKGKITAFEQISEESSSSSQNEGEEPKEGKKIVNNLLQNNMS